MTQTDVYVNDGNRVDTSGITFLSSLQKVIENVFHGQLVPKAWVDDKEVHAVIVFQQGNDIANPLTEGFEDDAWANIKG